MVQRSRGEGANNYKKSALGSAVFITASGQVAIRRVVAQNNKRRSVTQLPNDVPTLAVNFSIVTRNQRRLGLRLMNGKASLNISVIMQT